MMAGSRMRHPQCLAALAILRHPPANYVRSPVRSVAFLGVVKCPAYGVRFTLDSWEADASRSRAAIHDDLAACIPRGAMVIGRAIPLPQHALRHAMVSGQPVPADDLGLLARLRSDLRVMRLHCPDRELADVAVAYRLAPADRNGSPSPTWQPAALEAQCLWLHFLWTRCRPRERDWLASGWEAWRAIKRARSKVD